MILTLITLTFARDFAVKVHDRDGSLTPPLTVTLSGAGSPLKVELRDDGVDPDAVAGDRLHSASVVGFGADSGEILVEAGGKRWQGPFLFEAGSDPVLLIGLDPSGRANVSTHEVRYMPREQAPQPGPAPQPSAPPEAAQRQHTSTPDGMWLGYTVLVAALTGLGALAWAGARQPPQLPQLNRPLRPTTAHRGPFVPGPGLDLWVGPPPDGALALLPNTWTTAAIGLAAIEAASQGQPVRVVVGDPAQVDGDFDTLARVLSGRADLLWLTA